MMLRASQTASNLFDRVIEGLSDAFGVLPERWRPRSPQKCRVHQVHSATGPTTILLADDDVFIARIPIETDDAAEAWRAYELQSERLAPLPASELVCAMGQGENGAWFAALAHGVELDRLRGQAGPSCQISDFEVRGGEGQVFNLRGRPEMRLRRRSWGLALGSIALLAFALTLASGSLEDRSQRRLDALQDARRTVTTQIRTATSDLEVLAAAGDQGGVSTARMIRLLDGVAQARPDEWSVLAVRRDGDLIKIMMEFLPAEERLVAAFSQSLMTHEVVANVSTQRIGVVGGLVRLDVQIELEGDEV
jgi:hypothetical protein